jgi:nucleoside 2-deoxyribosyltransferase
MLATTSIPLLIGEIFVDFTLTSSGQENKLRLGGIVHAARSFWAIGVRFSVAAVLPEYLEQTASDYLKSLGCLEFNVLGTVRGAPNVTVIVDPAEVADQGYETLLRDERRTTLSALDLSTRDHDQILLFPGGYELETIVGRLPKRARLHLDVAYDVDGPAMLAPFATSVDTVFISTSSALFGSVFSGTIDSIVNAFKSCFTTALILKENRGGSRMVTKDGSVHLLPAQLGTTVNSVGVGDAFAAGYVSYLERGPLEAAWRATYVAAAYSHTTYPNIFREEVQRNELLSLEEMLGLWGVSLPWENRPALEVYFAAPDFSYGDRRAIDRALASLAYHNFKVRRPVKENGEIGIDSNDVILRETFLADYELLRKASLVFAVPTGRDPGTLVEIGIAIERGIAVVVFDMASENRNTMVVAGARHYSNDLDSCLNAVFSTLGKKPPS